MNRSDRVEWWLLGGTVGFGGLGALVGLVIGLETYWPTAIVALFELGIPSAVIGFLLGAFGWGLHALWGRFSRSRA